MENFVRTLVPDGHKLSTEQLKHPQVQEAVRVHLTNVLNTLYFGELYVGTPPQKMSVIYDTGSDWTVLESKYCANCLLHTYDSQRSLTHSRVDLEYKEHVYGSAHLYGYDAKDVVSLDAEGTCEVRDFEFFEIYKQYGISEKVDGILGLSRAWKSENY